MKKKINWKSLWQRQHHQAFKTATVPPAAYLNAIQDEIAARLQCGQQPIVFGNAQAVVGALPSVLDAVKVSAQDLNCPVEHKCLVLDLKTSHAVIVKAGDAIGLDPWQFVLLEAVPFASLRRQRFGKRHQGQVDQPQGGRLAQAFTRLAFWRTRKPKP